MHRYHNNKYTYSTQYIRSLVAVIIPTVRLLRLCYGTALG